jgi:hypothetical protein
VSWPYSDDPSRAELRRLTNLERRVKAIIGYYTPEDLAAHLAAALDGGETYNIDGVVRSVWVNHKLVDSFRTLYVELFPERPEPPRS